MPNEARRRVRASIWCAQVLIALPFTGIAVMKLTLPMAELSHKVPWAADYPTMVRAAGLIDLMGAVGIILPALLRILPSLTVWAAVGCSVLMIAAIIFHLARGEAWAVPINLAYLALALYVWWGRSRIAPIVSR